MSGAARRLALGLVAALLIGGAALAGGCGDDEAAVTTPVSEPAEGTERPGYGERPEESRPEAQGEAEEPAAEQPGTGGTGPGSGDGSERSGTGGTSPEDTAENDIPPPPGSPEERFEKDCERNPDVCG